MGANADWSLSKIGKPDQVPLRLNGFSEIPAKWQRRTVTSNRIFSSWLWFNQSCIPHANGWGTNLIYHYLNIFKVYFSMLYIISVLSVTQIKLKSFIFKTRLYYSLDFLQLVFSTNYPKHCSEHLIEIEPKKPDHFQIKELEGCSPANSRPSHVVSGITTVPKLSAVALPQTVCFRSGRPCRA